MNLTKYDASGNDFIIFHTFLKQSRGEFAKWVCNRQKGIGADGLIVLLPHSSYDFEWEFYNSDGSYASMCGNGSRAAAHYAYKSGLTTSEKMKFLTKSGVIEASVDNNSVEVKLTEPKVLDNLIIEDGFKWRLFDTGVPHLVTFVDDLKSYSTSVAKQMRDKYDANINFAKLDSKTRSIHVRTYERGVEGETLACGTGMAACFYAAYLDGDVDSVTKVYPTSREELILSMVDDFIYFKGRVTEVFKTSVDYSN